MIVYTLHYHNKHSNEGDVDIYATPELRDATAAKLMREYLSDFEEWAAHGGRTDVGHAQREWIEFLLGVGEIYDASELWGAVFDYNEWFDLDEHQIIEVAA